MMKMCFTLVALVFFVAFNAEAQSESQLGQHYQTVKAYAVRPNILLTAKFAKGGQVCEMVLEPRRYTEEKVVTLSGLSEEETVAVVEEIVRESERGKKQVEGFANWVNSTISGGTITTIIHYDNLTIQLFGSAREDASTYMVALVTWPHRPCD